MTLNGRLEGSNHERNRLPRKALQEEQDKYDINSGSVSRWFPCALPVSSTKYIFFTLPMNFDCSLSDYSLLVCIFARCPSRWSTWAWVLESTEQPLPCPPSGVRQEKAASPLRDSRRQSRVFWVTKCGHPRCGIENTSRRSMG